MENVVQTTQVKQNKYQSQLYWNNANEEALMHKKRTRHNTNCIQVVLHLLKMFIYQLKYFLKNFQSYLNNNKSDNFCVLFKLQWRKVVPINILYILWRGEKNANNERKRNGFFYCLFWKHFFLYLYRKIEQQ